MEPKTHTIEQEKSQNIIITTIGNKVVMKQNKDITYIEKDRIKTLIALLLQLETEQP